MFDCGGAPSITLWGDALTVLRKKNGKRVVKRDGNMLTPMSKLGTC
jgi:hypothetical protein